MSHPIHPALVHFPIACWSLGTIADVAGIYFGKEISDMATHLVVTGLVVSIPTIFAGALDLKNVKQESIAQNIVMNHITYVIIAWMFYAATLFTRLKSSGDLFSISMALSVGGFVCLVIAGWYGGKLVYEHGVGVVKH